MSLNIINSTEFNTISEEEEKLQKQTETIKKFFQNKISIIFQNRDETGNGISILNQMHKQSDDSINITEQNDYETHVQISPFSLHGYLFFHLLFFYFIYQLKVIFMLRGYPIIFNAFYY